MSAVANPTIVYWHAPGFPRHFIFRAENILQRKVGMPEEDGCGHEQISLLSISDEKLYSLAAIVKIIFSGK